MEFNGQAIFPTDPHGFVALMLCESVIHVLVERGVIQKTMAMEAIQTVVEVMREMADANPGVSSAAAADLISKIANSFALKTDEQHPIQRAQGRVSG